MAERRRCEVCDKLFVPDVRSRRHQKYCRPRCAKKAKSERDREHKKAYRGTGLGQEQRRRENRQQRERLGWPRYMSYVRKKHPEKTAALDQAAARRYYEQHREKILTKLRARRMRKKQLGEGCSQ